MQLLLILLLVTLLLQTGQPKSFVASSLQYSLDPSAHIQVPIETSARLNSSNWTPRTSSPECKDELSEKLRELSLLLFQEGQQVKQSFQYDINFNFSEEVRGLPLSKSTNTSTLETSNNVNSSDCRVDDVRNRFIIQLDLSTNQESSNSQNLEGQKDHAKTNYSYLWLFLAITVITITYVLYHVRVASLRQELSAVQSQAGLKIQEFQRQLGQLEEYQKMYEVYWDREVYKSQNQFYFEHTVFQGRFLNQPALVYAIKLIGSNASELQQKFNLILNCSHQGLAKLYYYTRNRDYLLVFTQKIVPLSLKTLPEHLNVKLCSNVRRKSISAILQAIAYLDGKVEIGWIPFESLQLEHVVRKDHHISLSIKINPIPCLLRNVHDSSDCEREETATCSSECLNYQTKQNLVSIFHLILQNGQKFNKQKFNQQLQHQTCKSEDYLEFLDYILYEMKNYCIGRENMFRQIMDHPFLWDSKRKILFLSDFSNYVETHIDDAKVKKLQRYAKQYNILKRNWARQFHRSFFPEINYYRKYDYESLRDLVRMIRNKLNHFHQIPKDVKVHVGSTPQEFVEYCLELFPQLLHFSYTYTKKKKWKLQWK